MRLIDADAFDKVLSDAQDKCKKSGGNFRYGVLANVRGNLKLMPTMYEKGTAYWVHETDRINHWHCSNCNQVWGIAHRMMNYCPNCGALMAGEKDDTTGI